MSATILWLIADLESDICGRWRVNCAFWTFARRIFRQNLKDTGMHSCFIMTSVKHRELSIKTGFQLFSQIRIKKSKKIDILKLNPISDLKSRKSTPKIVNPGNSGFPTTLPSSQDALVKNLVERNFILNFHKNVKYSFKKTEIEKLFYRGKI